MSNINFTCPHCSFQKQLSASTEGMQGNCPNCNAVVTITADAPANPQVSPQQPTKQIEEPAVDQVQLQQTPYLLGPTESIEPAEENIDHEPIYDLEGFDQNYADPVSMSPTIQPAPQQQPFQQQQSPPQNFQPRSETLESCKACGNQIARTATKCPQCGAITRSGEKTQRNMFIGFVIAVAIAAFGVCLYFKDDYINWRMSR
jgi:hypothetical protein